jgi:hypothetical protein
MEFVKNALLELLSMVSSVQVHLLSLLPLPAILTRSLLMEPVSAMLDFTILEANVYHALLTLNGMEPIVNVCVMLPNGVWVDHTLIWLITAIVRADIPLLMDSVLPLLDYG